MLGEYLDLLPGDSSPSRSGKIWKHISCYFPSFLFKQMFSVPYMEGLCLTPVLQIFFRWLWLWRSNQKNPPFDNEKTYPFDFCQNHRLKRPEKAVDMWTFPSDVLNFTKPWWVSSWGCSGATSKCLRCNGNHAFFNRKCTHWENRTWLWIHYIERWRIFHCFR